MEIFVVVFMKSFKSYFRDAIGTNVANFPNCESYNIFQHNSHHHSRIAHDSFFFVIYRKTCLCLKNRQLALIQTYENDRQSHCVGWLTLNEKRRRRWWWRRKQTHRSKFTLKKTHWTHVLQLKSPPTMNTIFYLLGKDTRKRQRHTNYICLCLCVFFFRESNDEQNLRRKMENLQTTTKKWKTTNRQW